MTETEIQILRNQTAIMHALSSLLSDDAESPLRSLLQVIRETRELLEKEGAL